MSSGISGKVDAAMKGASIFRRVMSTFVRAGNGRPFRDDAHISRVSSLQRTRRLRFARLPTSPATKIRINF